MVCKLLNPLYDLKQSPCFQYKRLVNFFLEKLGLKQINVDHGIFVTKANLDKTVLSIFVDDIKIIALKDSEIIEWVKLELIFTFFIIDIDFINFYLGLKMQQDRENRTIKLSQPAYINKILNQFQLDKAHTINTPIKKTALLKQKTEGEASLSDKKRYQGMTGFLILSIVEIRPDIAFSNSVAS